MNLLYITFLIFHKMDAFVLETRHMMNNTCIAMLYFIYSHLLRSLLLVLYYATLADRQGIIWWSIAVEFFKRYIHTS